MASIAKRPNGMWRARYRDDAGREHSRHFSRRIDAQTWLDNVTTAVVTGLYVDPKAGRVTFRDFYNEWSQRQVWVAGTVVSKNLAAYSTPFVDMPIGAIRTSHVEAWVAKMNTTLAPTTIATRFNNVRTVFRAAKRDKIIGADPTEGVALPRKRRAEAAMTIPTPAEVGAIISAAQPHHRALFALCAFAGLRMGEAAGVKVSDIDFLRRKLRVSRQVQRGGKARVEIRPPKYGSERTIDLPDDLVAMLAAHVEHVGVSTEGWLFRGRGANPPHQNSVGNWWRSTLAELDLEGVRLHDLRHFYASGLIASGCDVVTVQRALGHSSSTTTLRVYAHLWPSAEDRTRKAAQEIMAAAMNPPADSLRTEGTKNPV